MKKPSSSPAARRIAVIGAGISGLAAARTYQRAGHQVHVWEAAAQVGGRMAHRDTPLGGFDTGVQYFTVRDPRFEAALATAASACRRWSANAVRVLDDQGRVAEAARPGGEAHWVASPRMDALAASWAEPLLQSGALRLNAPVGSLVRSKGARTGWTLQDATGRVLDTRAYDQVILALPAGAVSALLDRSAPAADVSAEWGERLRRVDTAPCWVLMLAFAQSQLTHLGPHWNAAISTHHRVAWIARESSKPGRSEVERWTVQASAAWSKEHAADTAPRVQAKLERAFAELTGIRITPAHSEVLLWPEAKTLTPLGSPYLWSAELGLGLCGDWCLGHRVEHAFVSGLELALASL